MKTLLALIFIEAFPMLILQTGAESSMADAVAVWHLSDACDSAGRDSALTIHADVRLGVELEGDERAASLARGVEGAPRRGAHVHRLLAAHSSTNDLPRLFPVEGLALEELLRRPGLDLVEREDPV